MRDGKELKEGDWISLNGSTGLVYEGRIETQDAGTIANLNFAVDIQQVRHWLDENNKAYAGK